MFQIKHCIQYEKKPLKFVNIKVLQMSFHNLLKK